MPRLLLVDDNQSIHKIAETLLAATDIELTCASSGAEALEFAASRGPFDAALVDTTMLGMDGWELLDRFRHDPATARLPIAMMAGVLDVVDPEMVRKAPIQGFLKKPVELRDLADRVRQLAATPVEAPEPAPAPNFATMPYFKLSDHPLHGDDLLLLEPGDVLVEEESGPAPEEAPLEAPVLDLDETAFAMSPEPVLAFEEAPSEAPLPVITFDEAPSEAPLPAAMVEEPAPEAALDLEEPAAEEAALPSLELEELDLESLKVLPPPEEPAAAGPVPDEIPTVEELEEFPEIREFDTEDTLKSNALDLGVVTDELPDLGPDLDLPEAPAAPAEPAAEHPHDPAMALPEDWADESETLLELSAETTWTTRPPVDPILAEHSDFGPDSFLDAEPGPEPTPAFLPEIPEEDTPTQFTELAPEDELIQAPELEALPGAVDEVLKNAARDTVPWGTTLNLAQEIPPTLEWEADIAPVTAALDAHQEAPVEPLPEARQEVPATPDAHQEAPQPGADPLAAILADPVLMDRLAKAVVARLGDQVLREIAWEVMPELAGRLHRN